MAVPAGSRHVSANHPPSGCAWRPSTAIRLSGSMGPNWHTARRKHQDRRGSMGLKVTAPQEEVSGIPIPKLRAFYEAIGDGPIVLDLEAFVEWQGKGTRAEGDNRALTP